MRPGQVPRAALLATLLVAGCNARGAVAPRVGEVTTTGAARSGDVLGQLAVSLTWPRQAQVIPTDTQTVLLAISGPGGNTDLTLARQAGQSQATTSALLPQGGYTLTATAYDAGGALTASGTASAEVLADQVTSALVALAGLYVPQLESVSPPDGAPGTTVFLLGSDFTSSLSTAFATLFGSLPGTSLNVLSATRATVLVPPAAASGLLSVSLDGVPGAGAVPFTVLGNVSLATTSIALYPALGVTTATLDAIVTDTSGQAVSQPWVYWSNSTPSGPGGGVAVSFSAATGSQTVLTEVATVSQRATGTISVGSGELTTTVPFAIHP